MNWLAQFKPKQLTKQQLVKPIVESLCKLCGEADPEDHDQDDQLSASKFASQVGTLALHRYSQASGKFPGYKQIVFT